MAPSPTIRRLLKETKELSASAAHPNPAFHAAPISDDNLHEWHFTLLGPPAPSPYAGGIYHGRITLPPAYPMKPPNFRFLTPSGRFEVNREICLSISGFHEETWQPAWGVRTALVALRGFMGEEGTAGQVGGLESTKEIREMLAKQSRSWRCPSCGGHEEGENKKGWTNDERLNWWWDMCRGKGVNVEIECEGIEALPDGMKVETREVPSRAEKGKQKAQETDDTVAASQQLNSKVSTESSRSQMVSMSTPSTPKAEEAEPIAMTRSDEFASRPTMEVTTVQTNSLDTNDQRQRITTSPQFLAQQTANPADSPVTIDRAITVVLLALFIMILKKMFYPSSSSALGYDDLRMMRE